MLLHELTGRQAEFSNTRLSSRRAGRTESLPREQVLADDLLHDLNRATGDFRHARIDISPGDREFEHVAITSEELQAFIRRTAMEIGRHELDLGGIDARERSAEIGLYAFINEGPQPGRFSAELGQLELRVLEVGDRLSECLA